MTSIYEKRFDGRDWKELRPIVAKVGIIENADGSAYFRIGNTEAIAAVYGPRILHPRHLADPEKATLRTYYNMMTFSVPDRASPAPGRREIELSMVLKRALSPVLELELFPRAAIDVYAYITNADAGTRCASITAASMALADAGIPMKDLVVAVAVGKVGDKLVVDLNKKEEDFEVEGYEASDMPLAYIPKYDAFSLIQLDGKLSEDEVKVLLDYGKEACLKIYEIVKKALKEKYVKIEEEW